MHAWVQGACSRVCASAGERDGHRAGPDKTVGYGWLRDAGGSRMAKHVLQICVSCIKTSNGSYSYEH